MDRDNFSSFQKSLEGACCNKRLNKSASCSKILLEIWYGPVDLLISREERIYLISSLLVGKRKNVSGFSLVR